MEFARNFPISTHPFCHVFTHFGGAVTKKGFLDLDGSMQYALSMFEKTAGKEYVVAAQLTPCCSWGFYERPTADNVGFGGVPEPHRLWRQPGRGPEHNPEHNPDPRPDRRDARNTTRNTTRIQGPTGAAPGTQPGTQASALVPPGTQPFMKH